MENEKKIYLLEVWELRTNDWGDRTKTIRIMMRMVTLIKDDDDYERQALTKIVKKASKDNADNPDYKISGWIDDDNDSLFLMADWGSSCEKGNQWYGVEGVLTLMQDVTEI